MSHRLFKSNKDINSWLNQGRIVMFSAVGFHFFYKKVKDVLYTYKPSTNTWVECSTNFFDDFSSKYINRNYYTCALKDMKLLYKIG